MHGLINRTIQGFVRDTYGPPAWQDIARRIRLPGGEFEALLTYDPALTSDTLSAVAQHLEKPVDAVLEDVGTYLVSHPNVQHLRRLLRFGGLDFYDFLMSLDELPGRAKLALPDLELPAIDVTDLPRGEVLLTCSPGWPGFGHVLVGALRAMADDYGALAMLEFLESSPGGETVLATVFQADFSEGRRFDLATAAGA